MVKNTENVQGMKAMEERSAPIMSFSHLGDNPRFGIHNGGYGVGASMQGRPLPVRPDEEDIYAEADSFSSGPDSPPPGSRNPDNTYANRDATYANGITDHDTTLSAHSGGDSGATYTNGDATAVAGAGGDDSGPGGASVTVNGMAL